MKAAEWIDRVKAERGWETDYRAAKELGLSRNTISNYRGGVRNTLDDETATKVAQALDVDPEYIVLDQVAERTRVDAVRQGVNRLLERIGGKSRAGGKRGAPVGGGKGPVDITSAASNAPGGDPAGPEYTSYHRYRQLR